MVTCATFKVKALILSYAFEPHAFAASYKTNLVIFIQTKNTGASEIAQRVQALDAKPDILSSMPGIL